MINNLKKLNNKIKIPVLVVSSLLLVFMVVSLAACGGNSNNAGGNVDGDLPTLMTELYAGIGEENLPMLGQMEISDDETFEDPFIHNNKLYLPEDYENKIFGGIFVDKIKVLGLKILTLFLLIIGILFLLLAQVMFVIGAVFHHFARDTMMKYSYDDLEILITLQNSTFTIPHIEKILFKNKINIQKIKILSSDEDSTEESVKIFAKYSGLIPKSQIMAEISSLKDVYEVEI